MKRFTVFVLMQYRKLRKKGRSVPEQQPTIDDIAEKISDSGIPPYSVFPYHLLIRLYLEASYTLKMQPR